ncbi:MAG: nucleotidyltransferase domain-containing protein [Pyrinomonadaceae bacterium MAG19_C2-C3]|nr:nucleotidyltransferase domain-containing protein [Pyrinomonadaceae bacterium MAG19_C2-C3]
MPINLILPMGTQIVTRVEVRAEGKVYPCGAVGVIVEAPVDDKHSYRVRLTDDAVVALGREGFSIRKHAQRDMTAAHAKVLGEYDLHEFVIYSCVIGSRTYGLATDESDTDRRGIYLPPARLQWSLYGVPEQLEDKANEECFWELGKFLMLALKANPNVLECLYSPLVEHKNLIADELLAMRDAFLSKLVYQTFNGYVMSQFKKLEGDLRSTGSIKWKHAMHLIRLLISGVSVLRDGTMRVEVGEHRERLLAIKRGEVQWREVNEWRLALHESFDAWLIKTKLPERPDYAGVNEFLIKARSIAASENYAEKRLTNEVQIKD